MTNDDTRTTIARDIEDGLCRAINDTRNAIALDIEAELARAIEDAERGQAEISRLEAEVVRLKNTISLVNTSNAHMAEDIRNREYWDFQRHRAARLGSK